MATDCCRSETAVALAATGGYDPTMTPWHRFLEAVHFSALGVWLGALFMAGAAAAIVFPVMKRLNPSLPAYGAYPNDHWRIAAGRVGQKVFTVCDGVQIAMGVIVVLTMVALLASSGIRVRGLAGWMRIAATAGAALVLCYHLFVLSPRMNAEARTFWAAAEAGSAATADEARERFAAMHPTATRVMASTAVCLLIAIGAGAWHAAGSGGRAPDTSDAKPGHAPRSTDRN